MTNYNRAIKRGRQLRDYRDSGIDWESDSSLEYGDAEGNIYPEPTVFFCALCGTPIEVLYPSGTSLRFCTKKHKTNYHHLMGKKGRATRHNVLSVLAAGHTIHTGATVRSLVNNFAIVQTGEVSYDLTDFGYRLLRHYEESGL